MKSLRELHFSAERWLTRETMNLSYRRDGLKLYLFGFDIDQAVEVFEDGHFPYSTEENESRVLSRNYARTAETVYQSFWIEYNQLTGTGLDKGFFAKFPRIALLKVNGQVEDEGALLEFLMSETAQICDRKSSFESTISESNFIRRIELNNLHLTESEFIFKMKNLVKIEIRPPQISLDFVMQAFEHLNQLNELQFLNGENLGGCRFSPHSLFLGLEDEENYFYTGLRLRSRTDLFYILCGLQRELKSNNDLKEMHLLVEN